MPDEKHSSARHGNAMPRKRKNASHNISTLNESPLHKALKKRISQAYDRFERAASSLRRAIPPWALTTARGAEPSSRW